MTLDLVMVASWARALAGPLLVYPRGLQMLLQFNGHIREDSEDGRRDASGDNLSAPV